MMQKVESSRTGIWESIAPIELNRSIAYVDLDFLRTRDSSQFYTAHNMLYSVRVRPSLLYANSELLLTCFCF
jgi:hypothetical protein